ncbi:MAG: hypothetical protein WD669_03010 [Pirellulales bacterium]
MHRLTTRITSLERRLVFHQRAAAVSWTIATVVAAALVLGLVDYWLRFTDRGLRWIATALLAATVGWAIYRWWYVPSRRQLAPLGVARQIEAKFPQLRDALASAVEFLQQAEDDPTAGSAQLRRIVVAEAATAVDELPLDTVIDRGPLRRAASWAAVVLAALAVCFALDAAAVGTALARLVAPFGQTEWPREHYLEFRDPPTRLAVGQTFEAVLIDRSGHLPDDVLIKYRTADRGKRESLSEPMTRVGDVMVARRENVGQSFSFRAEGGDDHAMPWIDVAVVEPPKIESLAITVHPPAYTGLPAVLAERYLEVLAGTGIEVTGTASEPLAAARIRQAGSQPIAAAIRSYAGGAAGRGFHITPDKWTATASGPYELELEQAAGVAGIAASGQLRVVPDSPPSVAWQQPSEDLSVIVSATVPLAMVVKDDLAIKRVELTYERTDPGAAEQGGVAKSGRIELYGGPAHPATTSGDTQVVEQDWPIASLGLSPGAQLTLRAEAIDYRPGTGQTAAPRRLSVITIEQLDARLAERQTQIVRQLERALAAERATRHEVERVAIGQRDAGALSTGDRNALQAAELNQRRVRSLLADPSEGIPAQIASLLAELAMNHVDSPDLERAMRGLSAALATLAAGPLNVAERELTAARKTAEAIAVQSNEREENAPPSVEEQGDAAIPPATRGDELSRSLSTTGAAQDEVVAALERLVAELSDRADFGRFVRELTQLRTDQIAHEQTTRSEIGLVTLPLELNELSREQRASLNKASAGEDAIARRFEKIQQGMEALAVDLDLQDATASNTLKDAVALARRLAIAVHIRDAARGLAENRVGRALELETRIAADLDEVLDVLRKRGPEREKTLHDLRQAEKDLAALRRQLETLRDLAAQDTGGQRNQLGQRQEDLRRDAERLAQQMNRNGAKDAAQSTQQAIERLQNRAQPPQPGSQEQLKAAEQKLEDAARQLAERRAQEELDMALEFINRFRTELEQMIQRQRAVVSDTLAVDAARQSAGKLSAADVGQLELLAVEERNLAGLALANRELLSGLGAVVLSLQETERRLIAAAERLAKGESGAAAQEAERRALARLEAMLETFAQTVAEAQRKPADANAAGAPPPQQPGRRPAFELLEIKMLRMLQVELNERTRSHERQTAMAISRTDAQQAAIDRETRDLAAEQRRLAELVEEILSRNNSKKE